VKSHTLRVNTLKTFSTVAIVNDNKNFVNENKISTIIATVNFFLVQLDVNSSLDNIMISQC